MQSLPYGLRTGVPAPAETIPDLEPAFGCLSLEEAAQMCAYLDEGEPSSRLITWVCELACGEAGKLRLSREVDAAVIAALLCAEPGTELGQVARKAQVLLARRMARCGA